MNCPHCGSTIVFGGPRCCDGGRAKRAREVARRADLEERLRRIEERLEALEGASTENHATEEEKP